MLLPAKVIPFLQHDNAAVRALALDYLSEASDPNPASADDVWAAIDRHGPGKFNLFHGALWKLPQTEKSLDRALKALQDEKDHDRRRSLERVLGRLHYGLLLRYRDLIEEAPQVSDDLRSSVQKRVVLATVPGMELWERLMELAHAEQPPDAEQVERLIEALARSPEFAGWAINTLTDPAISDSREMHCVELLGKMRHRPAVGLIVERFKKVDADDMMGTAAHHALAHIGSVEVVQQLRQQYGGSQPYVRSLFAETLGRIKLSQSEAALIAMLAAEPDLSVKTSLATALCELATTDSAALDRLGTMVSTGQWSKDVNELDESVAALFAMVGRAMPKAPARQSAVFSSTPRERELKWDDERDEELTFPAASAVTEVQGAPVAQASSPPAPTAPKPIRRDTPKVGRNDPCPCGSGKKHKKCCGK